MLSFSKILWALLEISKMNNTSYFLAGHSEKYDVKFACFWFLLLLLASNVICFNAIYVFSLQLLVHYSFLSWEINTDNNVYGYHLLRASPYGSVQDCLLLVLPPSKYYHPFFYNLAIFGFLLVRFLEMLMPIAISRLVVYTTRIFNIFLIKLGSI